MSIVGHSPQQELYASKKYAGLPFYNDKKCGIYNDMVLEHCTCNMSAISRQNRD